MNDGDQDRGAEGSAKEARQQAIVTGVAGFFAGAGLMALIGLLFLGVVALGAIGLAFKFIFLLWH